MKVLYLYEGLPAYRKDFFRLLNEKLVERGHELKVLYGKRVKNESIQLEENMGFEVQSFPIKEWYNHDPFRVISFPGMVGRFKKERPDVYVLQFHVATLTYWRLYFYAKLHHIPYLTWDCNFLKGELNGMAVRIRKKLVDKTYINAGACLTYGSKFKNYLLGIGKKEDDVVIAQNTINIEKIISNRSLYCGDRTYIHPLHILYVGVINARKYVESAILAIAQLIKEGEDVFFDIVGGGDSYNECKSLINKLGMAERIVMHGPKHGDEVKFFFEHSDLFLLPGTGGLAINEAMAYSLPIISTEGDGTIIDLVDGNGFMLTQFGNVDEIKMTLRKFINLSNEEKQAMSKRSEMIVKQKASLENMVIKHIEAIEKVVHL